MCYSKSKHKISASDIHLKVENGRKVARMTHHDTTFPRTVFADKAPVLYNQLAQAANDKVDFILESK